MIINKREVGFFYSVGAHCAYSDYIIKNPEDPVSEAVLKKAVLMNAAWLEARREAGETDLPEPLTVEELKKCPMSVFAVLASEIEEQEKKDSEVTVEAEEPKEGKGKNGRSAEKSK